MEETSDAKIVRLEKILKDKDTELEKLKTEVRRLRYVWLLKHTCRAQYMQRARQC